jgi:hypothetical protein
MVVTWAFVLGWIFSVADWTDATLWGTVGIAAAALLLLVLLAHRLGSRVGAGLVAVLWSVALLVQLSSQS